MQHIVYVTYEGVYGSRSTREELLDELRPLALGPLLKLLAALNDNLRSEDNRPTLSVQNDLLRVFYSQSEIRAMAQLDWSSPPVVVHRQQLLFLLKEALYICPESGLDISTNFGLLGKALLRANDLLAHVFPKAKTFAERTLVAAAHFFSVQEAGVFHSYEYKMLRSYWILQKTLPSFSGRHPFFDIPQLFAAETHLALLNFQILQFMTMTAFIKEVARIRSTSPIDLPETWFSTTDFLPEVTGAYLSYASATVDQLRYQVRQHSEPSDFTPFRETPLLRLDGRLILLDFYFLCEKAESGPFWAARRQVSDPESNVYFSFWGDLFERYIADVLEQGADPQLNHVLPDPHFADGTQFADCAIVCGRALLMIEAKTSTISARAKYGADLGYLERTLRRNFVENGDSPKAVRQLINGIKKLFREGHQVSGINTNKIDTVFPIIVTRDEVGATVGINPFLNETFQKLLQDECLKIRQSITPLICLSAEDIERLSPRGKEVRFDRVFEAYFKGCKRDNAKLKPFMLTTNSVLRSLPKGETPDPFKDTAHEIGCLVEEHMRAALGTA